MSARLQPVQVAAGIIWNGPKFLAARRPPGKPLAGLWELPGGKLEAGETPLQALQRELAEELQINAPQATFRKLLEYPYPERGIIAVIHFFDVTDFSGNIQPCEGQEIIWLEPATWRELAFLPADAEILRDIAITGAPVSTFR